MGNQAVQTAPAATRPAGIEEVALWMQPSRRAEIEALAADMRGSPWGVIDQALQFYFERYGQLAHTPDPQNAIPLDEKPPDAEQVYIRMRPARRAQLEALASGMRLPPSTVVGVAFGQWLQILSPDRQRHVREARERAGDERGRQLDAPSLDARQQMVAEALQVLAGVAARYAPESFPVDARLGAYLEAVLPWLVALDRVRAPARPRSPVVERSGPSARDDAELNAMFQEKHAPAWRTNGESA